jgi:hypothetical protein
MEVSFIDGGNQNTQKKPTNCRKPQTNFNFKINTVLEILEDFLQMFM